MASDEPAKNRCKEGCYCIAPGCTNTFYRIECIHSCPTPQAATGFTKITCSYEAPKPVAPGFRVCSDHFTEVDYIYKPVKGHTICCFWMLLYGP